MPFSWVRPLDMPLDHPTDDAISDFIRSYDPSKTFSRKWHLWRDKMLRGRDTFLGYIPRHPTLPRLPRSHIIDFIFESKDWTPFERETIGLIGTKFSIQKHHPDNMLGLEPIVKTRPQEPVYFVGLEMASGRLPRWTYQFKVRGSIVYHLGYTEWARYILRTERKVLNDAGITHAVILSLFNYEYDVNLLKGLLEHWNPMTNTCYVPEEEIFPSLWDMKTICGLPILGVYYDEHVPDERTLFGEVAPDKFRHAVSLKMIFNHYYRLQRKKRGEVSITDWILHFVNSGSPLGTGFPSPGDPFGIGSEKIMDDYYNPPSCPEIAAEDIDRQVFLTAFLACWLCYFVIPREPFDQIRPEVLVMADRLAQGVRISLAPAALSNLFRSLRMVCTSLCPGFHTAVLPLHYLFGWLSMQFQGLYGTVVSENMKSKLPYLIHIAGAFPVHFRDYEARLLFRRFETHGHHRNIFPNTQGLLADQTECYDNELGCLSQKRFLSLEFLMSIRVGLLPFRNGDLASLEVYNPHRCARQFGFDQFVPQDIINFKNLPKDITVIAESWRVLLRYGTNSFFIIPSSERVPRCSYRYLSWHDVSLKAYFAYPLREICGPQKKKISRQAYVPPAIGFEFRLSESISRQQLKRPMPGEGPSSCGEGVEDSSFLSSSIFRDISGSTASDDVVIELELNIPDSEREVVNTAGQSLDPLVVASSSGSVMDSSTRLCGENDPTQLQAPGTVSDALEILVVEPLATIPPSLELINSNFGGRERDNQPVDLQLVSIKGKEIIRSEGDSDMQTSGSPEPLDVLPDSENVEMDDTVHAELPPSLQDPFVTKRKEASTGLGESRPDAPRPKTHQVLERGVRGLAINFLESFFMQEKFPSVDDFQDSVKSIFGVMDKFGIQYDAWKGLIQQIQHGLRQLDSDRLLSIDKAAQNYDSRITALKNFVQDLHKVNNVLDEERGVELASCRLLQDGIVRADKDIMEFIRQMERLEGEIERLRNEKEFMSSELRKRQQDLAAVEVKTKSNLELVQKSDVEINILERLQEGERTAHLQATARIYDQELALRNIVQEFLHRET